VARLTTLGERDTFPFEERTFLRTAIKGIVYRRYRCHAILSRRKSSVWLGKGESQAQWELVRAGLSLVESCEDFERQLPEHARSQADLLDFYLGSLREADRLQREFEQAVGDFLDPHGLMHEVIQQARAPLSPPGGEGSRRVCEARRDRRMAAHGTHGQRRCV
jgi:hypothetical protein